MARQVLVDLDFNSTSRITNLPDPTAAQHPATKAYVDAAVEGLAWKDNVRVASTGNVSLSTPGSSIDGVSLSTSDRVLLKDQSTASQNGIYVWNGASTTMTRASDASTFLELENAIVSVDEGTANAGTTWRQTAVNGTIDSSDVTWTAFGSVTANASETVAGKVEVATQSKVNAGTGTGGTGAKLVVSPDTLAAWSNAKLKYSANVGDGSNTSYTITHNLGTRDVTVALYRNSGDYDEVVCEVQHTSTTAVTLIFSSAPTSNQFRVVVLG